MDVQTKHLSKLVNVHSRVRYLYFVHAMNAPAWAEPMCFAICFAICFAKFVGQADDDPCVVFLQSKVVHNEKEALQVFAFTASLPCSPGVVRWIHVRRVRFAIPSTTPPPCPSTQPAPSTP